MAGKSNGQHLDSWVKPPQGPWYVQCGKFFYDNEEKSCMGRTAKRWGIVLIFYACFYAVLAAMFTVCMQVFFTYLDDHQPYYQMQNSLIGLNPGVTYRPMPEYDFTVKYQLTNATSAQFYVDQMEEFLQLYKDEPWLQQKVGCKADDNYGFNESPCFYIKVNRIYGWVPELYKVTDLPEEMSEDLKEHIKSLPENEQSQVWVSCWEEHAETSNETQFSYPWGRGLAAAAFPYTNTAGYRNPLVAVKVSPPVGRMVAVRCRAWAKNIIYDPSIKDATGYARIQIFIETDNSTLVEED